jgi:hypothetical protein
MNLMQALIYVVGQNRMIKTLAPKKNANFFRRKLTKIAKKSDHNIDPKPKSTSTF